MKAWKRDESTCTAISSTRHLDFCAAKDDLFRSGHQLDLRSNYDYASDRSVEVLASVVHLFSARIRLHLASNEMLPPGLPVLRLTWFSLSFIE